MIKGYHWNHNCVIVTYDHSQFDNKRIIYHYLEEFYCCLCGIGWLRIGQALSTSFNITIITMGIIIIIIFVEIVNIIIIFNVLIIIISTCIVSTSLNYISVFSGCWKCR